VRDDFLFEMTSMSAWRPLLLLLAMFAGSFALFDCGACDSSVTEEVAADDAPKPWGTMDGKSPFRLISTDISNI